jgi:predicted type IV restriction endonuclease
LAQSVESNNVSQANEADLENEEFNTDEEDKAKIITTEEELAAFEKIQIIIKTSQNYKFEIQYKDTVSYFGINFGKVKWWFLRLYLSSTKKTLIARLSIDEAKVLAPDFIVQEVPAATGEAWSKITISSVDDLDKLATLILRSYELEVIKH